MGAETATPPGDGGTSTSDDGVPQDGTTTAVGGSTGGSTDEGDTTAAGSSDDRGEDSSDDRGEDSSDDRGEGSSDDRGAGSSDGGGSTGSSDDGEVGSGGSSDDGVFGTTGSSDDGVFGTTGSSDDGVFGTTGSSDDGVFGTTGSSDDGIFGSTGSSDDGVFGTTGSSDGGVFGTSTDTGGFTSTGTPTTGVFTSSTDDGGVLTSSSDGGPLFDLPSPDLPVEPDNPGPLFTDVTVAAGLDVDPGTLVTSPFCQMSRWTSPPGSGDYCIPERSIGSVSVGDFDADGWPDIYMARIDGPDWLFQNQGDGTFVDVREAVGVGDHVTGGSAWVDIEGDGDLDLLITVLADTRNYLYVNDGTGNFTEDAVARGFALETGMVHSGVSIGVGDYDLDGYLDLFVGEWHSTDDKGPGPDHNRLLHNLGAAMPGHFEDVTEAMGIDFQAVSAVYGIEQGAWGFAPAFVDLNGDRYPELAVAADWHTSRLYENDTMGGFIDITIDAGVGTDEAGMGSTFADYDGDGDLDWFVSSVQWPAFGYTGNRMYRNDGDLNFTDATDDVGVRDAGWGWGASMFDADLDGDVDLAVTSGFHNAMFSDSPTYLWENDGPGPWVDVAAAAGIDYAQQGRGLTTIDYDRDGDLDLLIHSNTEAPVLYRNDAEVGSWLEVRTEGGAGNSEGIGAEVRVQVVEDGPIQVRHIGVASHYLGQAEAAAYFGLGWGFDPIHEVEVYWPATDTSVTLNDVARDQMVFVEP